VTSNIQFFLGNGAITVFILALVGLYQKLKENKTTLRAGLEAREQARNERDAKWIDLYRSAAEAHMEWDQDMRASNVTLQVAVNRLEAGAGQPLTKFEPIKKAPPLFPQSMDPTPAHDAHPGDQRS
jgi:hypothetical protein